MPPRTSLTHPLLIADTGHGVGLTLCPGKTDAHAMSGAWQRDLTLDLDTIAAWGARALVTLVEPHELRLLGVTGLPEAARARFDWVHLPIPDGGVPDAAWETRWAEAGPALHRHLDAGERVVVHCRGGLGRAGLVAARLLVERGLPPDEAVRVVRAVRPGAIETAAQERYVAALAPR
jgi:ADP-ribosyl-[dinitrogen reductase] hydrolase